MAKLSTFLWFDNQAEEAAKLYTSLFDDGRILKVAQIPLAGKDGDKVMKIVEFEMNGQTYAALDGGPLFPHSPAISLVVHCETQQELNKYWDKLTADGGAEVQCGWLRDKFGVSWQIVPAMMPKLLADGVGPRAEAIMRAVREMIKIDIATLQKAYDEAGAPV
jgi:predicted 3-demethylubiquinone-9 3-methyltransferase (glyoxalase superfamily)